VDHHPNGPLSSEVPNSATLTYSPDGRFWWDGARWQPVSTPSPPLESRFHLTDRVAAQLDQTLLPNEQVIGHVVGTRRSQAMVLTTMRVISLKAGVMAGAPFAVNVASYEFRQLTGPLVRPGVLYGVLSLTAPGLPTGRIPYSAKRGRLDAFTLPSALPFFRPRQERDMRAFAQCLQWHISAAWGKVG
jgi:hypothetical protein